MKVLLAVDSTGPSQPVVNEILSRPWPKETEFAAVHVMNVFDLAQFPTLIEEGRRRGNSVLEAVSLRFCGAGFNLTHQLLVGSPKNEIAEFARQWESDLVVVGSHGNNPIARLLVGSVAQGVLRSSPCSVEIVRLGSAGTVRSSHSMKILLATDGSDHSNAAARSVAARPWPADSEIRIISVAELPPILPNQMTDASLSAVYPESLLQELSLFAETQAQEAVEAARRLLRSSSLRVADAAFTPIGDARLTILEEAKAWGADLIVLGAYGRHGLARVLLGSVSESVAIHAHCSVEVIRTPAS